MMEDLTDEEVASVKEDIVVDNKDDGSKSTLDSTPELNVTYQDIKRYTIM